MRRRYRNRKNGVIIEISSELVSSVWEELVSSPPSNEKKEIPKKKNAPGKNKVTK